MSSSTNPNSVSAFELTKLRKANQLSSSAFFNNEVLEVDVVIIGSGAGGGVSAEIMTDAGLSVLIIEEGPHKTARDFKMRERDAYPQLYQESAGRKTKDKGITILQGRNVGGSTTVNWTTSFRTPDNTLKHWQKEWGLAEYTSEQMQPWFEQMEQRLNIEPWAIPANKNNDSLRQGAEKLGWEWHTISRNVKGCANLGYCGMGCPINAKQSMLITTIPQAMKQGAHLLHQARVENLIIENNVVKGCHVLAMDDNGQVVADSLIKIRARQTILSAGAIGSPAVLLRSNISDPYKLVGKRTFLHPVVVSAALMDDKVEGYSGAPQSIYTDKFLWPEADKVGFKIEAAPLHPLLVSTVITGFGLEHFELFKQYPYFQGTLALLRDGFNDASIGGQVELDDFGYPRLDYTVSDELWSSARKALLVMAELQFAAGAKSVLPIHNDTKPYTSWNSAKKAIDELPMETLKAMVFSAHVMGGNPMGSDVETSVVDQTGKYRHVEGLHIFDGSIFPTSIGANPQLSIYGIVAKLATQLAQKLKTA